MGKTFSVNGRLKLFETGVPWTYLPIAPRDVPDIWPGGWGSIPIEASIGKTTWKTSMFPLKDQGYFIPVKKVVLKSEGLGAGDDVTIRYSVAL